ARSALLTRTASTIATELSLYPNPARTFVTVSLRLPERQTVQVAVLDALGRQISSTSQTAPAGLLDLRVPLDTVAEGVYFLNVRYGTVSKTQRLVVTK
ncbi:MAG TPA: T9SS type A sorting domain-containing protein, partial [Hymenobacter sp.]|nr:T9SS type A sorting domain-containing protein [Hymenobacter sp.]